MRRVFIPILLLTFASALTSLPTAAQALPSKKEATTLLANAATAADLRGDDAPPYHLAADAVIQLGRDTYTGTYDIWQSAPDKYREVFQMQVRARTYVETDLALGDKLFTLRNTSALSFQLAEIRQAIRSVSRRFFVGNAHKVSRVYRTRVVGQELLCIDVDAELEHVQTCFDPVTEQIVSSSIKVNEANALTPRFVASLNTKDWEVSSFANLANKRYPRRIKLRDFDMTLELDVKSLDQVTSFDGNVFQRPAGATESDWCPKPVTGEAAVPSPPRISVHDPIYTAYYINVGPDGHIRDLQVLRSGGEWVDHRTEDWLRQTRFGILACINKPIGWEGISSAPLHVEP